jgi:hypothetical protein
MGAGVFTSLALLTALHVASFTMIISLNLVLSNLLPRANSTPPCASATKAVLLVGLSPGPSARWFGEAA